MNLRTFSGAFDTDAVGEYLSSTFKPLTNAPASMCPSLSRGSSLIWSFTLSSSSAPHFHITSSRSCALIRSSAPAMILHTFILPHSARADTKKSRFLSSSLLASVYSAGTSSSFSARSVVDTSKRWKNESQSTHSSPCTREVCDCAASKSLSSSAPPNLPAASFISTSFSVKVGTKKPSPSASFSTSRGMSFAHARSSAGSNFFLSTLSRARKRRDRSNMMNSIAAGGTGVLPVSLSGKATIFIEPLPPIVAPICVVSAVPRRAGATSCGSLSADICSSSVPIDCSVPSTTAVEVTLKWPCTDPLFLPFKTKSESGTVRWPMVTPDSASNSSTLSGEEAR
mmetsp:Transcript_11585/g.31066  ORF Transcript_11585/g.31066 Transcript_11585/m.31066 type:complete len:340 (-) Transcript_11585:771-1790(-)